MTLCNDSANGQKLSLSALFLYFAIFELTVNRLQALDGNFFRLRLIKTKAKKSVATLQSRPSPENFCVLV